MDLECKPVVVLLCERLVELVRILTGSSPEMTRKSPLARIFEVLPFVIVVNGQVAVSVHGLSSAVGQV